MKILLTAVNAKYIHTALGIRALSAYVKSPDIELAEFTVNERAEDVLSAVYERGADIVMFSCYIWNIGFILKLASSLKQIAPDTVIVFGGPEVSYDDMMYMEKYSFIDAVIRGEGEETLAEIAASGSLDTAGVTLRVGSAIKRNQDRAPVCDINKLPFPYSERELDRNREKLLYYEASRGCPFRCSYCLSSTVHSVRMRDIETVERELALFAAHDARIVKLTDRTFNADRKRAAELLRFLSTLEGRTQYHFEVAADLIDDELIGILKAAPEGRFLLEIGVQSTNPKTLAAIDRKTELEKIYAAVRELRGHAHMHLDLIAGLPYEDLGSFKKSFNDVMALRPDVLQLGFLKLLRGTKLRDDAERHGYRFTEYPPYEVLGNDYISYEELLKLKRIERVLESYYNSGAFENAMGYLLDAAETPYKLFEHIAEHFAENGYFEIGLSRERLYSILAGLFDDALFRDLLKLDYFINANNPSTPPWANEPFDSSLLKRRFGIIERCMERGELAEYAGMPLKEVIKHVCAERFSYDVLGDKKPRENVILFDKRGGGAVRAE